MTTCHSIIIFVGNMVGEIMPNKAFMHLEEQKRKRLITSALNEFSKYPYDQISINRIIQSIDMPRGSFYLYFNDKEDLYLYIFSTYHNILIDFLNNATKNSKTIIDVCSNMFEEIIEYCDNGNYGALLKMFFIGLNHNIENKLMDAGSRDEVIKTVTLFNEQAHQRIQKDIDIKDVTDLLVNILIHSISQYYIMNFELDVVKEHFYHQLKIVQKGIY